MTAALLDEPRLLHVTPGRARIHLPGWSGEGQRTLETRLRQVDGVVSARANGLTANVVLRFDPAVVSVDVLLASLHRLLGDASDLETDESPPPHTLHERSGHLGRARVTVRGLDRHPMLARQIVDRLSSQPGVRRVTVSTLTSRVLVEFSHEHTTLEDIVSAVAHIDLPDVLDEDQPAHPLDPAPLLQSASRAIASGIGLGLLAIRHLAGFERSGGLTVAAGRAAAALGILQAFPFVRNGLRRLFGRDIGDLILTLPGILVLTLAGSPLGLAVSGAESLRLVTEVVARRAAWRRYEDGLESAAPAHPGEMIRLESGDRTPLDAMVIEGFGTATGRHGLPVPVAPDEMVHAGARLFGGPFVLELRPGEPFTVESRAVPPAPSLYDRYLRYLSPVSLGYAVLTGIVTRSLSRTFQAFLLVNPRPALIGLEAADTGASARVLRSGVIVVGTRRHRTVRRPDTLLLDGPRVLSEGFEVAHVVSLDEGRNASEIRSRAAGIAAAAGSPWGGALSAAGALPADEGSFDGQEATATSEDVRYTVKPVSDRAELPAELRLRHPGDHVLVLRRDGREQPLGFIVLRPRIAVGADELIDTCRRRGVEIALLTAGHPAAAQEIGRRVGVTVLDDADPVEAVRVRQGTGQIVAFAADSAHAGSAFDACDLAIGISSGRSSRFPARADLLAPDLAAVAAIVDAGARRDTAVRDSVAFSMASNVAGIIWGFRGGPGGVVRASYAVYAASLAAIAAGWARLRGGERPSASLIRLVDPRPERWGRRSIADVLRALRTTESGLAPDEAAARRQAQRPAGERNLVLRAMLAQLRSPLTGILAAGAGLSLLLGSVADVAMISATIVANTVVSAWQERQTGQAVAALERIGTYTARVLRDGKLVIIPGSEVVPGDILVLAPGDRVAADARLVSADRLEVDEASLTGESLPVAKTATGGADGDRIVLAGTDVTVGSGLAAAFAVGSRTRMGATAAALALDETRASPLGVRLNRMLHQVLPLAGAGGIIVLLSGLVRGRPVLPQLAVGASIAIAAVPEGLPLLAGVGEAAVARRLVGRHALVRRLSAVEALGRVDVACADKTGTLTEGRLALTLVATMDDEAAPDVGMTAAQQAVLRAGGLATPRSDSAQAAAHPTDVAVINGIRAAKLETQIDQPRSAELPFDPSRSFHATAAGGHIWLKGAVEALAQRCDLVYRNGEEQPLDAAGREALLQRAQQLAERGLRVLMVARGAVSTTVEDPTGLTALGFLGISDPLRPEVRAAIRRCREAGVRVIMLTGDHPSTARAIARQAGLLHDGGVILTGGDIAELDSGDLDQRLQRAAVIARVTPLDKLRIVESLQRSGHTVAMTGDGVNDAPALRLADVGVAMGQGGTEVARQAADVVLADDDFSTLVEALVEGRSFWRNIRRALALLLGGNLGELGLVVSATALGLASPLVTRQILAVNLVTDVLPSLSVALQPPESRNLASLAREGTAALDRPLRHDVWRRGFATAAPSLGAFLLALRSAGLAQARSVAFASVVATQLAQTLDVGRVEGSLTRSVFSAVAGSVGVLIATLTAPPLRDFLALVTPAPGSWLLVGAASLVAVLLGRSLSHAGLSRPAIRLTPARVTV